MARHHRPGDGQRWFTFLRNHARQIASCDLFVVPTATFRLLYVFVVLSHDRRKILHFAVTAHPTDIWLAEQIRAAFSGFAAPPRFLLRDRDASYGRAFGAALAHLGIKTLRSSPQSPWQNPFVERVIGTIRRECLNHMIVLSASGLRTLLCEFVAYYNSGRAHQSLNGRPPDAQPRRSSGRIVGRRVLGGLHHVYSRAA
jgi:transposase InsO family protein